MRFLQKIIDHWNEYGRYQERTVERTGRKNLKITGKKKKPANGQKPLTGWVLWRRCRDLNPGAGRTDLPDFESGPFSRLGTSP